MRMDGGTEGEIWIVHPERLQLAFSPTKQLLRIIVVLCAYAKILALTFYAAE